MDQIFFGVAGNFAYDKLKGPIKTAWEQLTHKSFEQLYIEALDKAVDEIKPFLLTERGAEAGVVSIDRQAFLHVLQQDQLEDRLHLAVSTVGTDTFVQRIAAALAAWSVVIVDNSNLNEEGYAQLMRNLVRHANALFRSAIVGNEQAFREMLLTEAAKHGIQIDDLQRYIEENFGVVVLHLQEIGGRLDETNRLLFQSLAETLKGERAARERAEQELQTYKSRVPRLVFGFMRRDKVSDALITARIPASSGENWQADDVIEDMVQERRSEIAEAIKQARAQLGRPNYGVGFTMPFSPRPPTARQIDAYEEKCEAILEGYREALRLFRLRYMGRTCHIPLTLYNAGTVRATDIEVDLVFPDGVFLMPAEDEGNKYRDVQPPFDGVPTPPWERNTLDYSSLYIPSNLGSIPRKPDYPTGPAIEDEQRNVAVYTHPSLRPKELWQLDAILCCLSPDMPDNFDIAYTLKSNDLPDLIEGKLRVVLAIPPSKIVTVEAQDVKSSADSTGKDSTEAG